MLSAKTSQKHYVYAENWTKLREILKNVTLIGYFLGRKFPAQRFEEGQGAIDIEFTVNKGLLF